jgi:Ca2+-binding RTX toxin-like protein
VSAFTHALTSPADDTLTGGAGNDRLSGGRGSDLFVFNRGEGGNDTVLGLDIYDRVQLSGFGYASAADALAQVTQNGPDAVFSDAGQSIIFAGKTAADIYFVI